MRDYDAAHTAFLHTTAYWAPEWVNDPDMFAKMLDDVLYALGAPADSDEDEDGDDE